MIRLSWQLAFLLAATAGAAPPSAAPVEFFRVRVPPGRVHEVPLGDARHVPMSAAAFDRAVARLGVGPAHAPGAVVALVAYDVQFEAGGQLVGELEFERGDAEPPLVTQVPLGRLLVREATVRTAAGAAHAEVFGSPTGVVMRVGGAGRYRCRFAGLPIGPADSAELLPLVPALSSVVRIRVPAGMRPVVATVPAGSAAAIDSDGDAWLVRVGPAAALRVRLVPLDATQPHVRVWSRARIAGRRVDLAVRLVPDGPWLDGSVDLLADEGLTLVEQAGRRPVPSGGSATGRAVQVAVPPRSVGTRDPIDMVATAPIGVGCDQQLPLIRPTVERWAGGGTTILVDPSLAIEAVKLAECRMVGPADAAAWPAADAGAAPLPPADGTQPALLHVEPQSAAAAIALRLVPRPAEIDVARVTTVDMSPGAVVGRATCEVRIRAGAAFGIVADVAPGWFIDAVEAVEWQTDPRATGIEEPASVGRGGTVADPTRRIDWRVDRGPESAELRIELAEAATRSRGLGLRITGHRRGVPIGSGFVTSDMDMVRFHGESADAVLVDFRVGPEAVIEVGGSPIGVLAAEGRLAPLVEPGASRGRMRGGVRAGARDARLVRRRPPLDADVQVQAVARDGQLAESSTFVCRADTGVIDAIVVHFSESLGETVEWSLLKPEGTVAVPRRLDATSDAGLRPRVAESWVVEFRPAVEGSVTFRAARTLPFVDAVPATLAWVEGATEERGTLLVRGAGGVRPAVLNRRLWELPPEPADARDAAGVVAEFRYAGPDSMRADTAGSAAAEIVPVPSAEARAWVWTERTTAWCHESGGTEFEAAFDVENRGRGGLTLSVPRGVRVQEIIVAGEPAAFDGGPTSAAELRIEVPQDRVRCEVVVRGVAAASGASGWRWIDPAPFAIDAPVLGRSAAVMVPVELDVVGLRAPEEASPGWTVRLFDAAPAAARAESRAAPMTVGFRRVDASAPGGGRPVLVVRRSLVASLAILAGMAAAAVTAWLTPRHLRSMVAAGCVAAIVALWVEPPLVTVARAVWWGVLAGLALGSVRRSRPVAVACLVAAGLAPAAAARGAEPYRVYVTEESDGGTVLVPEPLFRLLAADEAGAAAAVQVRNCRVDAARFDEPWSVSLDVESDQGGVLVMRQDDGGRWSMPGDLPPGVAVDVSGDGIEARVVATVPGRRRVTLGVVPAAERRGLVEIRRVSLPPAAAAAVVADEGCQCDREDLGGPWTRVALGLDGFDVSHARAVRLVRGVDPRHPLADDVGDVTSCNEVTWSRVGARLSARFEIDAGRSIIRAAVVRASPGLVPAPAASATALGSLPGDRWVVEIPEPRPGRTVIDLDFDLPLTGPVGVFDLPAAWLERTAGDARTVKLRADPEFEVVPELSPGLALVRQRDADPRVAAEWRADAVAVAPGEAPDAADQPQPPAAWSAGARIAVRRRPAAVEVAQELDLEYAADQVGMTLEAEIASLSGPLTTVPIEVPADAVIDGCSLHERAGEDDHPGEAIVARPTADRLIVAVQRPRPGRFRLRLAAHVPTSLGRAAPMPLMRCDVAEAAAVVVTWRSTGDVRVDVPAGASGAVREVPARAAGPLATVTASGTTAAVRVREPGGPAPPGPDAPLGSDLADVSVQLALDGRGRAWGLARFEVAAGRPLVRLRMPPGTRVFDVLVDGREARAVPRGADAWELTLHDIRWPRTILVVFAGDVGGRLERGDSVRLEPPRIDAGAGRAVMWAIEAPAGMSLRAVDPAEPLDQLRWRDRGAAARGRMAEAFDAALENVAGPESGRLAAFAGRRRLGEMPTLEASWERGFAAAVADRSRLLVSAAGDGSVTVRGARGLDPTASTRTVATAAVLALSALAWGFTARRPEACSALLRPVWPWGVACTGLAWIALLRPTLPGVAMLAIGGLAAALGRAARWRPRRVPATIVAAEASTRTLPGG